MRTGKSGRSIAGAVGLFLAGSLIAPGVSYAKTAQEIDSSVSAVLVRFMEQVSGSRELLQAAKGVLVFTDVIQAGFGIGGQYGEGALRIRGRTVDYYNIAAASIGFQLGAQKKDIILVFLQDQALQAFRAKNGWQVGVDGSVVLVTLGTHGSIDTTKLNQPIVGFVIGQAGLMYNLTLEGSKISKIQR
jgi:lipid-binding SYLF domain-containing protein